MIKFYKALKDNTITNAFSLGIKNRATGSNMGAADIVEVFSIYGQASGSGGRSQELSRAILEFDVQSIIDDRASGLLPASGSVEFRLRMFNAKHVEMTPNDYELAVHPLTEEWQEGYGLDLDQYKDKTFDNFGSNWEKRSGSTSWTTVGGTYDNAVVYSQSFPIGTEDLDVDVSATVESWVGGGLTNNGFMVKLGETFEAYYSASTGANSGSIIHNVNGLKQTKYTKNFFGRGSEFFHKVPVIQAVWSDVKYDDRGGFVPSSSLAPAADNINKIKFYNYQRGRLVDIPGTPTLTVDIYSSSNGTPSGSSLGTFSVSKESTGVYSADVHVATTLNSLNDVWMTGSTALHTGSIRVKQATNYHKNTKDDYVVSMIGNKKEYQNTGDERFRVHFRKKDWRPTLYDVAVNTVDTEYLRSASYSVYRDVDDLEVISHNTGSYLGTVMSYNVSGSYFDLDMSSFESGYSYYFKFAVYDDFAGNFVELEKKFRFRIK